MLITNVLNAGLESQGAVEQHISDEMWYLLAIGAMLLAMLASLIVRMTFSKYNKVRTQGGRTAAEIAREMLNDNGLHHVQIIKQSGNLTDHYDPRSQVVALSESVHDKDTVGAIGVAAHEVGHAIQHAVGYAPIKIRHAIFPVVNFGSRIWIFLLLIGIWLEKMELAWMAIILYAFVFVFQLVTLPLEIDASRRAMNTISSKGYLVGKEISGARKTLTAAAFTYFAALLASLVQLLRLLSMMKRR
ncbi:MAG: zinc metallopeptidase [Oscillospiraceae bacterium]|nr:zinc metallopeptidase [Oscillospiraceae bacterium]